MKKVFYTLLVLVLVLSACGPAYPPEPEVSNQSQFNNQPLELVVEYKDGVSSFRVWKFSDEGTTCYLTQNTEFRDVAISIWCNQ